MSTVYPKLDVIAVGLTVVVLFEVSLTALREFLTLTRSQRADHMAMIAAFYVVLPAQYGLIAIGWYGLYTIFIPVYAGLALPILVALQGDTARFMERIAALHAGLGACRTDRKSVV